jgi:glucose-6-phosphate isomerase
VEERDIGKSFTDIVNIGIGGSDLGPAWLLKHCSFINHMNVHFVSNIDGDHVNEVIKS